MLSLARPQLPLLLLLGGLLALLVAGCAAKGSLGDVERAEALLEVMMRMAGPVDDSAYYFVAFDTDDDRGATFPVPVAAGPFWGNGWGTGSITHYLEYHLGQYNLFRTQLNTLLRSRTGGFLGHQGNALGSAAGVYELTAEGLALGAVTVTGAGRVASAQNLSCQNAGTLTLATDPAGQVLPGSVAFTPAADGGRPLTSAEQAAVNALNAGGVILAPDSLAALGLSLTLDPAASGAQTLLLDPTLATVRSVFTSASTGVRSTFFGTVTANSRLSTTSPPLPGLTLLTGDLSVGDRATFSVELSPNAILITPNLFQYTLPAGGTTLRASFDLAALGDNLTNLSLNFITKRELIFDPTVTDPDDHVYDGLGPLGNDAILQFDPRQFRTITNDDAFVREGPGDLTLRGPGTQAQKDAVDLVDWSVSVRRLR